MLQNYLMEKLYTELFNATFKRFIKCAKMYLNNYDYFSKDSLNCTYNKTIEIYKRLTRSYLRYGIVAAKVRYGSIAVPLA
jgi:hypothetical protein